MILINILLFYCIFDLIKTLFFFLHFNFSFILDNASVFAFFFSDLCIISKSYYCNFIIYQTLFPIRIFAVYKVFKTL